MGATNPDEDGRKQSKSLGNVVSPQKVWDNLGADILRYKSYFTN